MDGGDEVLGSIVSYCQPQNPVSPRVASEPPRALATSHYQINAKPRSQKTVAFDLPDSPSTTSITESTPPVQITSIRQDKENISFNNRNENKQGIARKSVAEQANRRQNAKQNTHPKTIAFGKTVNVSQTVESTSRHNKAMNDSRANLNTSRVSVPVPTLPPQPTSRRADIGSMRNASAVTSPTVDMQLPSAASSQRTVIPPPIVGMQRDARTRLGESSRTLNQFRNGVGELPRNERPLVETTNHIVETPILDATAIGVVREQKENGSENQSITQLCTVVSDLKSCMEKLTASIVSQNDEMNKIKRRNDDIADEIGVLREIVGDYILKEKVPPKANSIDLWRSSRRTPQKAQREVKKSSTVPREDRATTSQIPMRLELESNDDESGSNDDIPKITKDVGRLLEEKMRSDPQLRKILCEAIDGESSGRVAAVRERQTQRQPAQTTRNGGERSRSRPRDVYRTEQRVVYGTANNEAPYVSYQSVSYVRKDYAYGDPSDSDEMANSYRRGQSVTYVPQHSSKPRVEEVMEDKFSDDENFDMTRNDVAQHDVMRSDNDRRRKAHGRVSERLKNINVRMNI